MPRLRRISWLNYPHLVIAEANGGSLLFPDESDYHCYIGQLRQMSRERMLRVYAFCLMPNEIRLVVQPIRLMLPRIIQRLHTRHTIRVNQKVGRVGHLFRGRFRSLVFDENDLIDVVRAVHLWPVRQGLMRRPEHYPFSSHSDYMGVSDKSTDFLAIDPVLSNFFGDPESRRRSFAKFVEQMALEPDDYGIKEIYPGIGARSVSGKHLIKKAEKNFTSHSKRSSVQTLADRTSLLLNLNLSQIMGTSRRQDFVMARRLIATAAVVGAGRSVSEVATFLKKDKAQVSRLVTQGMDLLQSNEPFSLLFDSLKAKGAEIV